MNDARPPQRPDLISVGDALASLAGFDQIIDVRSESEFALDHVPGAINMPVLNDAERVRIGTLYKQASAFIAKKHGAVLVARNIAHHIETDLVKQSADWRPLVYCWRGGKRSGALVIVLRQIGWRAQQLDGGYKAFRRAVVEGLVRFAGELQFCVLTGPTGSGKSQVLQALAAQGAQVLDLESIGRHKGSVLGGSPDLPQPSQKMFETQLWATLRQFDANRTVYVEAESQRLGNLRVPNDLILALRESPCVNIDADVSVRTQVLLGEYTHYRLDRDMLVNRLQRLHEHVSSATLDAWETMARAADLAPLVHELLVTYYDPLYRKSTARNYRKADLAPRYALTESTTAAVNALATRILSEGATRFTERLH